MVDLTGPISYLCQDYVIPSNGKEAQLGQVACSRLEEIWTDHELFRLKAQLLHPPERLQLLYELFEDMKKGR